MNSSDNTPALSEQSGLNRTGETRYVIVTPARDEDLHLHSTLDSVVKQTILPLEWVIVDDGSSDRTPEIIQKYANIYPWITAIRIPDRGARVNGSGPMEAFHAGLNALHYVDWDFLVKLDADVSFSRDYFSSCFRQFQKDPRLGVGGGVVTHDNAGTRQVEQTPSFHVRGATKIYRRQCWQDIKGLTRAPGWDTIDEVKANQCGWATRSFSHLPILHHRLTGAAAGWWRNAVKNGRANYIAGYHPLFMLAKCCRRAFQKPYIAGALGLLYGFVTAYLYRQPQVPDHGLIRYLRRQQLRRLAGLTTIWQ